jgi:hypothetical protein
MCSKTRKIVKIRTLSQTFVAGTVTAGLLAAGVFGAPAAEAAYGSGNLLCFGGNVHTSTYNSDQPYWHHHTLNGLDSWSQTYFHWQFWAGDGNWTASVSGYGSANAGCQY